MIRDLSVWLSSSMPPYFLQHSIVWVLWSCHHCLASIEIVSFSTKPTSKTSLSILYPLWISTYLHCLDGYMYCYVLLYHSNLYALLRKLCICSTSMFLTDIPKFLSIAACFSAFITLWLEQLYLLPRIPWPFLLLLSSYLDSHYPIISRLSPYLSYIMLPIIIRIPLGDSYGVYLIIEYDFLLLVDIQELGILIVTFYHGPRFLLRFAC